jgi:hypothetical protein
MRKIKNFPEMAQQRQHYENNSPGRQEGPYPKNRLKSGQTRWFCEKTDNQREGAKTLRTA